MKSVAPALDIPMRRPSFSRGWAFIRGAAAMTVETRAKISSKGHSAQKMKAVIKPPIRKAAGTMLRMEKLPSASSCCMAMRASQPSSAVARPYPMQLADAMA